MQKKDGVGKLILLGVQHAFAMFCATILVPILTGLDPAVALLAAGIGTLIFHLCTGGKVPVFLGSSFAFIPALVAVIGTDASQYGSTIPSRLGRFSIWQYTNGGSVAGIDTAVDLNLLLPPAK